MADYGNTVIAWVAMYVTLLDEVRSQVSFELLFGFFVDLGCDLGPAGLLST